MPVALLWLSRGCRALVDPGDFALVRGRLWRHRERSGKRITYTLDLASAQREILMHHMLLDVPQGSVVVHVNHNGLDNRRANLRIVDRKAAHAHAQTRCGIPGVWYDATGPGWHAQVLRQDGLLTLGPFEDAETARQARDAIRRCDDKRLAELVEPLDEEPELDDAPAEKVEEARGSVRGVRAVRNNTGIAGVTREAASHRYLVRVDGRARRFRDLNEASREASIALTLRAQRGMQPAEGERVVRMGRYDVLLDRCVAEWLPQRCWSVRRRSNGLLDVRRPPTANDDPDRRYSMAADYLLAPSPQERVVFINGNRLDLRVANLRLEPRRLFAGP